MPATRERTAGAAGRVAPVPAERALTTEEFADLFEARARGQVDDDGRDARLLRLHAAGLLERVTGQQSPACYTLSEAGLTAVESH